MTSSSAGYVLKLRILSQNQEASEIAYSLVQYINDYEYVVEPEKIHLPVLDTEEVTKKYSSLVFDKRFAK